MTFTMRRSAALVALTFPALLAAQAPAPRDTFFMSGTARIHYVDRGAGQPIVFLHGYTGSLDRHLVASGVAPNLEKDHRVIGFDLRGHGTSDKPYDPAQYGAQMGLDVIRLLDHLRIERAHVVGYSLGAFITGWLLTTYPNRIATATLVAGAPPLGMTGQSKDSLLRDARELESDVPFRSLVLALTPPGAPTPTDSAIRALSQQLASRNDVRALAALQRGRSQLVVTPAKMAAVTTPTLGIVGTADPLLKALRELHVAMPQMRLVVVDSATHAGPTGILRTPQFFTELRAIIAANRVR
jgi:pimeloyl-ACP methyl ester carboxylesterase